MVVSALADIVVSYEKSAVTSIKPEMIKVNEEFFQKTFFYFTARICLLISCQMNIGRKDTKYKEKIKIEKVEKDVEKALAFFY